MLHLVTLMVVIIQVCGMGASVSHLSRSRSIISSQVTSRSHISMATSSHSIKSETIPDLNDSPPKKILLIVEPTPFNYISGYANRFKEMLDHLRLAGDDVHVITTDGSKNPPSSYKNYSITNLHGISLPMYPGVRVSMDWTWKIRHFARRLRPDLIHVSTPSLILYPTLFWSRLLKMPLVMSYHTNILEYVRAYFTGIPRKIMMWIMRRLMKFLHNAADLTLCTSPQILEELKELGIKDVDVWLKGINTNVSVVAALSCME